MRVGSCFIKYIIKDFFSGFFNSFLQIDICCDHVLVGHDFIGCYKVVLFTWLPIILLVAFSTKNAAVIYFSLQG